MSGVLYRLWLIYSSLTDVTGLKCVQDIEKMQEMAQSELQDYVRESSSTNHCRFARILLRLPAIKTISSIRVEEIFFSPLIGDVKIDHILPSILSNNSGSLVWKYDLLLAWEKSYEIIVSESSYI